MSSSPKSLGRSSRRGCPIDSKGRVNAGAPCFQGRARREMLDGLGKEWARLMLDELLRLRAEVERKNAVIAIGTLHSALCTTAFVMRRLQTSMKR